MFANTSLFLYNDYEEERMKKYNTLYVVILTILFAFLLTWLFPITYLNGEFISEARSQAGLFDLFTYPMLIFYNFIYVLLYALVIGGFYGLLNKTKAYRLLLDKFVKFLKGKELWFWIISVLVLSLIVSFTGFTFEMLIILPFVAAIILMLGYDKITVAMVTVGSIAMGIIGSTFSNSVVGTFINMITMDYSDLLIVKFIILVLGDALLVFNIVLYNKKKSTVDKIEQESIIIPEKVTRGKEVKLWPLITILSILIVVYLVAGINWENAFGITIFTTCLESIQKATIFGYTVFDKLLGTINAFGSWTFYEYTALIVIAMVIIKFVYRVKLSDAVEGLGEGVKRFIYAGLVMILSYTVLVLTSNHPVMLTILKPILLITDGFNSVTLGFSTFVSALFNTDFTYYQYNILTLNYVSSYITDTSLYPLCALITQSMYGLAMLVAPTSLVLLYTLSTYEIGYIEWLKKIWKFLVELLVLLFIIFTILLLV